MLVARDDKQLYAEEMSRKVNEKQEKVQQLEDLEQDMIQSLQKTMNEL